MGLWLEQAEPPRTCSLWHHPTARGHQVSRVTASRVQGTPQPSFWVTRGALGSPKHLSSTQEAGVCVHTFLSNRRNHAPEELLRDARLPPSCPAPTAVPGGAGWDTSPAPWAAQHPCRGTRGRDTLPRMALPTEVTLGTPQA